MDNVSGIREEGGCEFGAVGGAMEEGLRFRGSGEGSFRGEGDLVPTRYEWRLLPLGFSAWVCVLRVGDSRVTLLLPK